MKSQSHPHGDETPPTATRLFPVVTEKRHPGHPGFSAIPVSTPQPPANHPGLSVGILSQSPRLRVSAVNPPSQNTSRPVSPGEWHSPRGVFTKRTHFQPLFTRVSQNNEPIYHPTQRIVPDVSGHDPAVQARSSPPPSVRRAAARTGRGGPGLEASCFRVSHPPCPARASPWPPA